MRPFRLLSTIVITSSMLFFSQDTKELSQVVVFGPEVPKVETIDDAASVYAPAIPQTTNPVWYQSGQNGTVHTGTRTSHAEYLDTWINEQGKFDWSIPPSTPQGSVYIPTKSFLHQTASYGRLY